MLRDEVNRGSRLTKAKIAPPVAAPAMLTRWKILLAEAIIFAMRKTSAGSAGRTYPGSFDFEMEKNTAQNSAQQMRKTAVESEFSLVLAKSHPMRAAAAIRAQGKSSMVKTTT